MLWGLLAGERDSFWFWGKLPQHNFLHLIQSTHPKALPAHGRLRLKRKFLVASAERYHQIDLADLPLHDIFWARALWEGAEDLLQSGPFRKLEYVELNVLAKLDIFCRQLPFFQLRNSLSFHKAINITLANDLIVLILWS
jgi:hypothetical protein